MLKIQSLVKSFGGLKASDDLSFEVHTNELHAIIGPNGAGKTVLLSQLTGMLEPDSGSRMFDGQELTGMPIHSRSAVGLARSFQITNIFGDMSTLDNVALAVQAHQGHSFRFWKNASGDKKLREPAFELLSELGLENRADVLAGNLSYGEQRQLEIAMALACKPKMLLLDEPMAGMGPDESHSMIELLSKLKGKFSILLVEHDMDAVFTLADRITVLVYGKVIACDVPEKIRSNTEVKAAYLGEEAFENA